MGNQSVLCPVCQGVTPASEREAYTPLRGRLIITNGYCPGGCAERRAAAEQAQQQHHQHHQQQHAQQAQAQQQTQQMARPATAPPPLRVAR